MTDGPVDPLLGGRRSSDDEWSDDAWSDDARSDDEWPDGAARSGDDPSEGVSSDSDDAAFDEREALYGRRRLVAGGVVAALALLIAVIATRGGDDAPRPPTALRVDAWAPYWAFDRSIPDLREHGDVLTEVSPFVYLANGPTEVVLDPAADADLVAEFIDAARDAGLAVVPSILDRMAEGGMAAVLRDPTSRTRHVETIVALADEIEADGIDIDYEQFAFADDRSTWTQTRPAFSAFIAELAAALDADGRSLTVSVPPVYDDGTTDASGYWVYDYAALAQSVDHIRVMAYDYSGQAAGPISPLSWVQRSIEGSVAASGRPESIVLGIPLYGNNVPIDTAGDCPEGQEIGRTAVTIRSVDELIERRDATPVLDPETGEWTFTYTLEISEGGQSCSQVRQVNYVDSDGARARIDLAIDAGLGGVSLWALGYEDDSLWALVEPLVFADTVDDAAGSTP